ncbi:hypothetical protein LZ30DRAFT_399864 [Colletotrichum cereale]|nr:hypothetical protein LZ30DRAFT_399864 [Colletotrichum cereale]
MATVLVWQLVCIVLMCHVIGSRMPVTGKRRTLPPSCDPWTERPVLTHFKMPGKDPCPRGVEQSDRPAAKRVTMHSTTGVLCQWAPPRFAEQGGRQPRSFSSTVQL